MRRNKHTTLFFLTLLYVHPVFAQGQNPGKIDSLVNRLTGSREDTTRVNLFLELSKEVTYKDLDKSKEYASKALSLSQKLNYTKGIVLSYKNLGDYFQGQNKYDSALACYNRGATLSEKAGLKKEFNRIRLNTGIIHAINREYSVAEELFLRVLGDARKIMDHDNTSAALNNLANIYRRQGKYRLALTYYYQSVNDKKTQEDKLLKCIVFNNIGHVYGDQQEFAKARKSYSEALAIATSIKNPRNQAMALFGIGGTYVDDQKYDSALLYLDSALVAVKKIKDVVREAMYGREIARVYVYQNKPDQALKILEAGEELIKGRDGTKLLHASLQQFMAEAYLKKRQADKAEALAKKCLLTYETTGERQSTEESYDLLARIYSAKSAHKEAANYYRKLAILKDSLAQEKYSLQMAEMETIYDTQEKERYIETQRQEVLLLTQEKQLASLWRNILIAGSMLLGMGIFLTYYLLRQRNRRKQELLENQEAINRHLVQLNELKSRFFANISHEFRTPLTLIIGPVEEKLLTGELTQKDKIVLQSIKRAASRLLELINQVLELSKLESGIMKPNPKPGNLYNFILPILSSFDSMADISQTEYVKKIDLPETTILFDADKLEKILTNLLSNAFKYSPKSGLIEVTISATDHEDSINLLIKIKNSGPVIPPNLLDKIFEPFFQIENETPQRIPGTGLGLSLVKELVKFHHGDVHVTSELNEGTVFTVFLSFKKSDQPATAPLLAVAETITMENPSSEIVEPGEIDSSKAIILIVEDNAEVRAFVRQGLEGNYNILEAQAGNEGLQLAQTQQIDLIISDVMMPVMNGIELCHQLKNNELTSHIPIILLTARADHESKLEGLRTGADDYVGKPFNMQELQARTSNLIEQRRRLVRKYNQQRVIQPHEITVTPLDERFLQKAIQVIENNLSNIYFGVDLLSSEMNMSRTNLLRKIKAVTGLTTNEFIQDFRLRRAAHLMEMKADTITQIAFQVGFNDQSYFTKCFKKKFGKTPSEFIS